MIMLLTFRLGRVILNIFDFCLITDWSRTSVIENRLLGFFLSSLLMISHMSLVTVFGGGVRGFSFNTFAFSSSTLFA